MNRKTLNTLIVDDHDMDCKKTEPTLEDIELSSLGFVLPDLEKFDLIVYKGKLGKKVLKLSGV